jgi:hypothetical protein
MAQTKESTRRPKRAPSSTGSVPSDPASAPTSPTPPVMCTVAFCPICAAVTAVGQARPDLVEHVLMAGREMLLALRALIDARLEGGGDDGPTKLERLTIE